MTAPRRLTAAFIALGTISLSCSVTPPSGYVTAALDPMSYAAFESSDEAGAAAKALGDLHTGLTLEEVFPPGAAAGTRYTAEAMKLLGGEAPLRASS